LHDEEGQHAVLVACLDLDVLEVDVEDLGDLVENVSGLDDLAEVPAGKLVRSFVIDRAEEDAGAVRADCFTDLAREVAVIDGEDGCEVDVLHDELLRCVCCVWVGSRLHS